MKMGCIVNIKVVPVRNNCEGETYMENQRINNRSELNQAVSQTKQSIIQSFQDGVTQAKDDLAQAENAGNPDSIKRRQEQLTEAQNGLSQAQSTFSNTAEKTQ
ncbi:hypothetical protein CVD25_09300 [Bacillus canaveralius]|uniref:Uncharacterized protein n=2 Tax=Bacillaceae TaxID=186817 RepID=A0A2N5GKU0_9BACI|nr:hypothetical protein CU635_13040 [Bacillus canaveralius]PLR83917.1 hypothetical protein CVD23_12260 [Bacillus sp. V33-4]PLR98005.1 hypothetical protein CVD25_09300 [Bacillus canaveralius]RSK54414.1 DUF1090 family protein [Bacillus canaveralius]